MVTYDFLHLSIGEPQPFCWHCYMKSLNFFMNSYHSVKWCVKPHAQSTCSLIFVLDTKIWAMLLDHHTQSGLKSQSPIAGTRLGPRPGHGNMWFFCVWVLVNLKPFCLHHYMKYLELFHELIYSWSHHVASAQLSAGKPLLETKEKRGKSSQKSSTSWLRLTRSQFQHE